MKAGDVLALRGGRRVVVRSAPRRIAGGEVVEVAWQADNLEMKLSDGSVHPAHRAGWAWEEPICNLYPAGQEF